MTRRPPELRAWGDEIVVDSFAGGGGASLGIELALGRGPDIAINHDAEAIALHQANHPHTRHFCENVWKVDPRTATGGRPVGLMWLSPDCFPAGTMILTRDGYRAIETVRVGDAVLTHRGRWRPITELHRTVKPVMRLRAHGHPGLTVSIEHPFYARQHQRHSADWVPASGLSRGWYVASPTNFPAAEVPAVGGRSLATTPALMWLVGRYLGDGWTRLTATRAELVITCGPSEVDELRSLLAQWPRAGARAVANELAWHERATRTAYQFTCNHRGFVTWLREHFGHRAEAKRLPGWALGMDATLRESLLAGYLSADGSETAAFVECTTVSKALAFGVKALAQSLGKTVGVYTGENSTVIEGRTVHARPYFRLRWRHTIVADHAQTWRDVLHEWVPVRETVSTGVTETVYNIGVAGDESYVVEGLVVHNCKHFSKAKGGKPVSKKVRGLAWVAVRWAKAVQPRVIVLENVEEFQTWGPLDDDGKPCPLRKGLTFRRFVGRLRALGYEVEWRELRACDYGAPTIRKRLFLVARRDGQPIAWPEPTHGPGRAAPWRTAAEIIDWSLPCPSIFLTRDEGKAVSAKRPLADATMRRIAAGVKKYVLDAAKPFIVSLTHHGGDRLRDVDGQLPTITAAHRGELALAVPTLIQTGYGEREGQEPRVPGLHKPLGTVVAGGSKHAVVAAFMAQHNTDVVGHTMTEPVSTIVGKGSTQALVASSVVKLKGTSKDGQPIDTPLHTVQAGGNHYAEVRAFLVAYYSGGGQAAPLDAPAPTVVSRDRLGLVTVAGHEYAIVDIGMRMLAPRELYRAQGFPETYRVEIEFQGKPLSKSAQTKMCGNSVCPPLARAIIAANYAPSRLGERVA